MIYVTGDIHGDINRFSEINLPGESSWTEEDCLIICGDFGFIFKGDEKEKAALDILAKKPYRILWADGNHENFSALSEFPEEKWQGGKIHRIRHNVYHLMRGQVFTIEGKKFFTMGGAYSIDRYMRKRDVSYWEAELPVSSEYREASDNLKANGMKVDYIITHTAPREIIRRMGHSPDVHDMELTGFLEWVMYDCSFRHWYFGHWHEDRTIGENFTALYFDTAEIK